MPTRKRKPFGPSHKNKKISKMIPKLLRNRQISILRPAQFQKEQSSYGLACTCFKKIHPDPDCPLHCGDVIR